MRITINKLKINVINNKNSINGKSIKIIKHI